MATTPTTADLLRVDVRDVDAAAGRLELLAAGVDALLALVDGTGASSPAGTDVVSTRASETLNREHADLRESLVSLAAGFREDARAVRGHATAYSLTDEDNAETIRAVLP